jgi:hypothetical protein
MYSDGEALILTQLQAVSGFSSANTSRGKWGILNDGVSRVYGILKPGSFIREQAAMSVNLSVFQTIIQVWYRYKDDDTLTLLESSVSSIITRFDQYRKLADTTNTIVEAFVKEGREVEEMWTKDGGLSWLKQDLIVEWQEYDGVSYAE